MNSNTCIEVCPLCGQEGTTCGCDAGDVEYVCELLSLDDCTEGDGDE